MLLGWGGHSNVRNSSSVTMHTVTQFCCHCHCCKCGFIVQCPSLCSALQPTVSEAPSALHCEQGWTAVESCLSYISGHKARWLLALLKPILLEPSMKWWWKVSRNSHPVCVWLPGWAFSMHKRLGVTDYVSASCSSVLWMPNACSVKVILEWCSVPNPIKPVSLVAHFSWLAHLQVHIPHCGYPKMLLWKGCVHPHFATRGTSSEPYMCGTFTCELGTNCDMYCRLWIHCWFLALLEWSSRCKSSVCGVLFLWWCHCTGDSDEVFTGLHPDYCISPRRLHYL